MQLPDTVADLLAAAEAADRAMLRLVARVMDRREEIEATGVTVEVWLANQSRLGRFERRDVLTAADVLPRMPLLWQAWQDGVTSWSIVAQVVRLVATQARGLTTEADDVLGPAAVALADADPDQLLDVLYDWLARVRHAREARREATAEQRDRLVLQPAWDGTGGTLWGEFAATSFAAISDAIIAARPDLDVQPNPTGDVDLSAANRMAADRANAAGLLRLCSANPDGSKRRPLVVATTTLQSLLDLANSPARLVTQLTGGAMAVTADTFRRLGGTDQGADLRLVVTDDNGIVGIGRKARLTPEWLREAQLSLHVTCVFPGCRRPARRCPSDHAEEFEAGGITSAIGTAPLCHEHHRLKTPNYDHTGRRVADPDWVRDTDRDGTVTWLHRPTGLTLRQPSLLALADLARPARRPDATTGAGRRRTT